MASAKATVRRAPKDDDGIKAVPQARTRVAAAADEITVNRVPRSRPARARGKSYGDNRNGRGRDFVPSNGFDFQRGRI